MKSNLSFFLSFFLSFNLINAQNTDFCMSPELFEVLSKANHGCSETFQPYVPELTVRINLHFINGVENSFYPGADDDTNIWNGNIAARSAVEQRLNEQFMANMLPHPSNIQPAISGDSKIRFELYSDPMNTTDIHGGIWYHNERPDNNDFPYDDVLNVVVFSERPEGQGASAIACGYEDFCNWINIFDWGENLSGDPSQNHDYILARRLVHELGHITGLCHSFAPNQDCLDVDPSLECNGTADNESTSSCLSEPTNACDAFNDHTNNFMSYGITQRSLTPCQWNKYYGFLYVNRPSYVDVPNCSSVIEEEETLIISTGEHLVFDELTYIKSDIVIEANASLTVNCALLMAKEKSITVKRAGKLIVDNGVITKAGDKPWLGIFVEGNANKIQPNPSQAIPNYSDIEVAGTVFLNYSTISGANTAINTHHRTTWWLEEYWGGLVVGIKSNFIDNRRAVAFWRYNLFHDDYLGLVPNKSFFDECIFKEVEEYRDDTYGVTIWGCTGINFMSCTFENLDQTAIYGINCGFKITDSGVVEEVGYSTNPQSIFKDNLRNIEVFSTFSNITNNIIIQNARFENNIGNGLNANLVHHISIEGSNEFHNLSIMDCQFYRGKTGMIIDGAAGFTVVNNTFESTNLAMDIKDTGSSLNELKCNTILNYGGRGIRIKNNNENLLIRYNDFITNGGAFDIDLVGNPTNPKIIKERQGSSLDPARNCFERVRPIRQIVGESSPFRYVVHDDLMPYFDGCRLIPSDNLSDGDNTPNNYSLEMLNIPLFLLEDINCNHSPPDGIKDTPDTRKLDEIKEGLTRYEYMINIGGGLNANEQIAFENFQEEYSSEKRNLLGNYQQRGRFDDMETILLPESAEDDKRWLLGSYFQAKDWTKAQQLINELPNNTNDQQNYRNTMAINLAALQQNYIYELSEADEASLYEIAYSDSPSRVYARGVLALLKSAHFEPDESDLDIEALQIATNTSIPVTPSVRYYPNPSAKSVFINIAENEIEQGVTYVIKDVTGRQLLLSGLLFEPVSEIDLTKLKAGVFFLELEIGQNVEIHKLIRL